jgi:AraC-like DNA-binding protein
MGCYHHSQKQLILNFKKYVGLSPKYYQRILRFNDILQKIHNREKISWAEVAYNCGYSDQSHFIKEFNHFSGFNPQEFIKREFNKEETNFFPLNKKG